MLTRGSSKKAETRPSGRLSCNLRKVANLFAWFPFVRLEAVVLYLAVPGVASATCTTQRLFHIPLNDIQLSTIHIQGIESTFWPMSTKWEWCSSLLLWHWSAAFCASLAQPCKQSKHLNHPPHELFNQWQARSSSWCVSPDDLQIQHRIETSGFTYFGPLQWRTAMQSSELVVFRDDMFLELLDWLKGLGLGAGVDLDIGNARPRRRAVWTHKLSLWGQKSLALYVYNIV